MSRRFHYKDSPLSELNEEMDALWRHMDAFKEEARTKEFSYTVGTGETEIRHGLGRVPKHVYPTAQSAGYVWETRNATETSVFLAASIAGVRVKVQVS